MSSINRFTFAGNLTDAPQLSYTTKGDSKLTFTIATNKSIKQPDGTYKEYPSFHKIVAWRKGMDKYAKMTKGQFVTVEGEVSYSTIENEGGKKTYYTNFTASNIFAQLPKTEKPKESPVDQAVHKDTETPYLVDGQRVPANPVTGKPQSEAINPDDIPF